MLNPSTADATKDDATIRKCIGFAMRWGYGGIDVVNLFAWRARDWRELRVYGVEAIGPENDRHLSESIGAAAKVVAAWGDIPFARVRAKDVARLIRSLHKTMHCIGRCKSGAPCHPLMQPYAKPLEVYR